MSGLGERLKRMRTFFRDELWRFDPLRPAERALVRSLQFAIMVGEGFVRDQLLLRASALTYFSVLAIVPLLAIASAVVTALGVTENVVGPIIDQFAVVVPEGAKQLRGVLDSADLGALGAAGALALLLTTVLGIGNVERALNHIWGVRHERPLARRVPDYLAVLIVGPLLMGVGLSLATTVKSQWLVQRLLEEPVFRSAFELGLRELPTLVLAGAFCFLYWFMPNTRVRFLAALLGGVFSALAVNAALSGYVGLSVGVARAQALYGVFAQLPLFFVWIYLFWAIALLGAEISFAVQNLSLYRREVRDAQRSPADREALGLRVAVAVASQFQSGDAPLDTQALSETLDAPVRGVRDVAARLVDAGLLARQALGTGGEALGMAQSPSRVQVADVLDALRGRRNTEEGGPETNPVETMLASLDAAQRAAGGERSLEDLTAGHSPLPAVDLVGTRD